MTEPKPVEEIIQSMKDQLEIKKAATAATPDSDGDFEPEEFLTETTGVNSHVQDTIQDIESSVDEYELDQDEEEEYVTNVILAAINGESTSPVHGSPINNGFHQLKAPVNQIVEPLEDIKRKHRTLCFVLTCANPSEAHFDRATKAIVAYNTPGSMKVDLVSVADGKLYPGLAWTGDQPGGIELNDLAGIAQALGYVQFVIVGCIYGN